MTREEALQILDRYGIGEQVDALELAIEALSAEPCGDCISRKQALRIAELGAKEGLFWQQMQLSILPSVQPKPKTEVLDKIRAEIADLDDADYDYEGYYKAVTDALKIIDKYKAEKE